MNNMGKKLVLYYRAAKATRSLNFAGFPLAPKTRNSPFDRGGYNTFIFWISQLGLEVAKHIVDVGANHGDFSRAASYCYPRAEVWLFEPLPSLLPVLNIVSARYPHRWHLQPFALGSAAGTLPLHIAADDSIGSFLGFSESYRKGNPTAWPKASVDAQVERLDDFCRRMGIGSIALLKIDVEGFEFDVLAGAEYMLAKTNAIVIEVSLIRDPQEEAGALPRMISLLCNAGFQIVDLIPSLFSREQPWRPLEYNLLARRTT